MPIIIDQPDKICPHCGKVIPANIKLDHDRGDITVDYRDDKKSLIICEQCARNAMPPMPKKVKEKGPDPRQENMDQYGSIFVK